MNLKNASWILLGIVALALAGLLLPRISSEADHENRILNPTGSSEVVEPRAMSWKLLHRGDDFPLLYVLDGRVGETAEIDLNGYSGLLEVRYSTGTFEKALELDILGEQPKRVFAVDNEPRVFRTFTIPNRQLMLSIRIVEDTVNPIEDNARALMSGFKLEDSAPGPEDTDSEATPNGEE